jgi:hypothetical protein
VASMATQQVQSIADLHRQFNELWELESDYKAFYNQRSGRRLKPWWVSSAKIRHSGKVQCFSVKEGSYASPLA